MCGRHLRAGRAHRSAFGASVRRLSGEPAAGRARHDAARRDHPVRETKPLPPVPEPGLCFCPRRKPPTPGGGMVMSRAVFVSAAVFVLALSPSTTHAAWGPDSVLVLGGTGRYGIG